MRLFDIYVADIYMLSSKIYKQDKVLCNGRYLRQSLVLRKEKNDKVIFYDLISKHRLKFGISNSNLGDEYIGSTIVPVTNYMDEDTLKQYISKRKILKIYKSKKEQQN